MGYDYYQRDDVTEYLAVQRQRIADLEAENRALRAQLDALCRGEGVAVLINGQRIPLAALAEAAAANAASGMPAERSYAANDRSRRPSAPHNPYHHPAQRVPLPSPQTPSPSLSLSPSPSPVSGEAVFPEASWLTGAGPAVRPVQPVQPVQRGHNTGARALRPSERITPQWLREARHSVAGPQSSASQHPQDAWPENYSQPQLGTLAQITGQGAAMRPQRRDPQARNPYADSFVLD